MIFRYLLLFFLLSIASCDHTNSLPDNTTFQNPLLPSGPDPWIIQKDSFYYYTHTLDNRIELWKTKSVSRVGVGEHKVIWRPPATGPNSHHIWAPELHFFDNKWYIYYTAGHSPATGDQRMFVLENSSANPMEGEWIHKGKLADPTADLFALDATVLEYNDKRYLFWSSTETSNTPDQNLYCAELKNPWSLATKRHLISTPTFPWERLHSPPAKGVNEGPQILKNKFGRVFLFFSASECWSDGYGLGMLTLTQGGDPLEASDWKKNQTPVFSTKSVSNAFGPGHNAFFKSPDGKEDWIIYHANSQERQYCGLLRNPRIQKFTWNADGTPHLGQPVPIFVNILRPSGEKD
ncbi:MAG TPA: glycoside hydrolase family 43 protein [Segetibacter sp.]|jgi:GH43 family beta-xylosidase